MALVSADYRLFLQGSLDFAAISKKQTADIVEVTPKS